MRRYCVIPICCKVRFRRRISRRKYRTEVRVFQHKLCAECGTYAATYRKLCNYCADRPIANWSGPGRCSDPQRKPFENIT